MSNQEYNFQHVNIINAAHELIRFDEVELALKVLDCVPAHHRDFKIDEIEQLKMKISAARITPHAYMSANLDQQVSAEDAIKNIQGLLRGRFILEEVSRNRRLAKPDMHIVDVGPGEYWLPIGLDKLGYWFTYQPIAMDSLASKRAYDFIKHLLTEKPPENHPILFAAHEIIEHLPSTDDLTIECLRHCGRWPDYIHLSTPLYTFDPRHNDWDKPCGLPHLRAYTPKEFAMEADRLFPGYKWEYKTDAIQSLRGYKESGVLFE